MTDMKSYKGFQIAGSKKDGYRAENAVAVLYADNVKVLQYKISRFIETGDVCNGYRKEN